MRKLQYSVEAVSRVLVAIAIFMFAGLASRSTTAAEGERVKIASHYVRENGCHETHQIFTTQVPNMDRLDRSYHGVLDGIEVVETAGNNGHGYRNFAWVSSGVISYELYAKGAGYWVDPPKVFGVKVGGGYCHGAAGASEGVDIFAHYRTP